MVDIVKINKTATIKPADKNNIATAMCESDYLKDQISIFTNNDILNLTSAPPKAEAEQKTTQTLPQPETKKTIKNTEQKKEIQTEINQQKPISNKLDEIKTSEQNIVAEIEEKVTTIIPKETEVEKFKKDYLRLMQVQAQKNYNNDIDNGKLKGISQKDGEIKEYLYKVSDFGETDSSIRHRYNIANTETNFFKNPPKNIMYGGELTIERADLLEKYKKVYTESHK